MVGYCEKGGICVGELVGGIFANRLDCWLLLKNGICEDQLVGGIFANWLDSRGCVYAGKINGRIFAEGGIGTTISLGCIFKIRNGGIFENPLYG